MTLEIKLIVAAVLLLALGVGGFVLYRHIYDLGEAHTQALWDADKAAQALVLAKAQADTLAAQKAKEDASNAISVQYEQKLKDARARADALASLVRGYEDYLRAGRVPEVPATPGGTATAPAGPGRGGELEPGVDAAIAQAINACAHDAAQLDALIAWNKTIALLH